MFIVGVDEDAINSERAARCAFFLRDRLTSSHRLLTLLTTCVGSLERIERNQRLRTEAAVWRVLMCCVRRASVIMSVVCPLWLLCIRRRSGGCCTLGSPGPRATCTWRTPGSGAPPPPVQSHPHPSPGVISKPPCALFCVVRCCPALCCSQPTAPPHPLPNPYQPNHHQIITKSHQVSVRRPRRAQPLPRPRGDGG